MNLKKTELLGTGPVDGPTTAAGHMMYDSVKPSSAALRILQQSRSQRSHTVKRKKRPTVRQLDRATSEE
jgi:hypothetical protein